MKLLGRIVVLYFASISLTWTLWAIIVKVINTNIGYYVIAENIFLVPSLVIAIYLTSIVADFKKAIAAVIGTTLGLYLFQFLFDLYTNPPLISYAAYYPADEVWKYKIHWDKLYAVYYSHLPWAWIFGGVCGFIVGRLYKRYIVTVYT